ncbi:unnamed protein product [Cuscuta epithymum]|uniref:Pectin acetylesterase n=1 Tax=Cuscuta epithymum TaxID=186058 RepID=A0AAV0G841_9ASTE|nr:unnamed protein product [Cuscuta epithymum]CAH9144151.1 unnamed protein product [Cuscuta epithymum]
MEMSTIMFYWFLLCAALIVDPSKADKNVSKTLIPSAVAEGAVCLDGSPPAYHYDAGKGSGARNWLVHLGGGGWCLNSTIYKNMTNAIAESCTDRATSDLGSSFNMTDFLFEGIFSDEKNQSYFYNWNRVIVRYCDGGSFSGDVDQPDPATKLFYRGARIYKAVINELMTKGMEDAENVILAGGSAGGIGAMIHCDHFRSLFHPTVNVKCYIDSSLFLKLKDPKRAMFFKTIFGTVVELQQSAKALPVECTSERSPSACFFPKTLVKYIKTPIYLLNSAFDSYQIRNMFSEGLHGQIMNHTVTPSDMELLKDFRQQIIKALPTPSATNGYLVTSQFGHSFGLKGLKKPMFPQNKTSKTMEKVMVEWFFGEKSIHIIDPNDEPFWNATLSH